MPKGSICSSVSRNIFRKGKCSKPYLFKKDCDNFIRGFVHKFHFSVLENRSRFYSQNKQGQGSSFGTDVAFEDPSLDELEEDLGPKTFSIVKSKDNIKIGHKNVISKLYSSDILNEATIKVRKNVLAQDEPVVFGDIEKSLEQKTFDELQYRKKERKHKKKSSEVKTKAKGNESVFESKGNIYTDAVLLPEIDRKQYYAAKKGRVLSEREKESIMVRETKDGYLDIFDKDDPHYWSLTLQVMNDLEDLIFDDKRWMLEQDIGEDPMQYIINQKWDFNITVFTRVLFILAIQGRKKDCQSFFEYIQKEHNVVPDTLTYLAVMQACALHGDYVSCNRYIHEIVEKHGLTPSIHNYGAVVQAYIVADKVDEASHVIEMLREHDLPTDIVMHTMLLKGFIKNQQLTRAWKHFQFMQTRYAIMPDTVCFNVMLNAAAEGGEVEKAISMYYQFEPRGLFVDSTTFNTLIKACSKRVSHRKMAFEFADQMEKQGFRPNIYTLNSLILACAKDGNVERGYKILEKMRTYKILPNEFTFNLMFFAFAQNQKIEPSRYSQNITNAETLLLQMEESGIEITTTTINSFLQVFTNAKDRHIEALHHFKTKYIKYGLKRDEYSYGMLIYMFSKMDRTDRCLEYLKEMISLGIKPLYDSYKYIAFSYVNQGDHDKAHDILRQMHSESGYLMAPQDIRHFQKLLLKTTNKYKELKVQRSETALLELD